MSKSRIILALLLCVTFVAPAFAVDFKLKGDFDNRFSFSTQADLGARKSKDASTYVNVAKFSAPTNKESKDKDFFGELKYRLTMTASDDEKKVKGVLGIEIGAAKYGTKAADFGGDAKNEDSVFEFRFGYIDFEVPFDTASRVSMGLQPVKYNKWLWSDSAAGVKWTSKRGHLAYSLGWWRDDVDNGGKGGDLKLTNDDVYAFDVTYTVAPGNRLNGFVLYRESGAQGDFVDSDEDGTKDKHTFAGTSNTMDQETWIGLAGEMARGNLFGGFTFIYETGEIDAGAGEFANGKKSLDREAFLVNLEGTAKLDRARIKLGWTYASGDDDPTDGDVENFNAIDIASSMFGSVVIFDSLANDNSLSSAPYFQDRGGNVVYLRGDYDLTAKTSIGAEYLWINTAENVIKDKDLGHEFVVRASHKIAKGFTAKVQAGYFVGGDAWDELADNNKDGEDGDNVFRTDVSFRYKF